MNLAPGEGRQGFFRDLRLLFVQAFSDQSLIDPATYASYNIALGALLLVIAVLSRLQVAPGSIVETVVLAVAGTLLVSGLALVRVRPALLERLLLIQGVLVISLAFASASSTVVWSFRAPPHAQFRYLPGVTLVLMLYGFLQLAEFGPRTIRSSWLRRTGLWLGIGTELVSAACLLLRFTRI
jgi:hypothetical protein